MLLEYSLGVAVNYLYFGIDMYKNNLQLLEYFLGVAEVW